jgi:hypothetical protein
MIAKVFCLFGWHVRMLDFFYNSHAKKKKIQSKLDYCGTVVPFKLLRRKLLENFARTYILMEIDYL